MILNLNVIAQIVGSVLTGKRPKPSNAKLISTSGSITTLLGDYVVEPIFVVTEQAQQSSKYKDILEVHMNMFTTIYANAFNVIVNVEGIEPRVAFKMLSSNVDDIKSLAGQALAKVSESEDELEKYLFVNEAKTERNVAISNRDGKPAKEPSQLYKNIIVKVSHNIKNVEIPVMIKPIIAVIDTQTMLDYVSLIGKSTSFIAQLHRYRADIITGKEFVFSTNLLNDIRRKELTEVKGDVDIFDELDKRKTNFKINEGGLGFGRSYGSLIISSNERKAFQVAIKGDLKHERTKNNFLGDIGSFSVAIIDDVYEYVAIYMRNFTGVSRIPFDSLKKENSEDKLLEVFKGMTNGGGF